MEVDGAFIYLAVCLCFPVVSGLQCPTCTYVTHTANIPDLAKSIVNTLLDSFQSPECARPLTKAIPEIHEETCATVTGTVSRCSFYAGTITMKFDMFVTEIEIPLKVYQRGCINFAPASVPSDGCRPRNAVSEDKTFLKQALDHASSALSDVVNFVGELCVCGDTYCDTSGANDVKRGVFYTALMLMTLIHVL